MRKIETGSDMGSVKIITRSWDFLIPTFGGDGDNLVLVVDGREGLKKALEGLEVKETDLKVLGGLDIRGRAVVAKYDCGDEEGGLPIKKGRYTVVSAGPATGYVAVVIFIKEKE